MPWAPRASVSLCEGWAGLEREGQAWGGCLVRGVCPAAHVVVQAHLGLS